MEDFLVSTWHVLGVFFPKLKGEDRTKPRRAFHWNSGKPGSTSASVFILVCFFLKKKKFFFFVFHFLCFPRPSSLFRQWDFWSREHTACSHHPQHFWTWESLKYLFRNKTPCWCKHRNCTRRQIQWDAWLQSLLYTDFLCDHGQKLGFSLKGQSTMVLQHSQGCPRCPPVIL